MSIKIIDRQKFQLLSFLNNEKIFSDPFLFKIVDFKTFMRFEKPRMIY